MTLDEAIERYISNAEYERTHGNLQGCLDFKQLAEWLKELKQLSEQIRWIPVSERPPKENKTVIASTKYGVYPEAKYTKEYGWEWAYEAGADYWRELKDVTAWMPLPEPYKAESEGE